MKKTLKTPMIVFFILSLVFTLGWMGSYLYFNVFSYADYDYSKLFANLYDSLILPIPPLVMGQLYGFTFEGGTPSYLTYVAYALIAFSLFLLVYGIVVAIQRKRARYIWYVIAWPFVLLGALHVVVAWPIYQPSLFFQVDLSDPLQRFNLIFVYAICVCVLLAYVFYALTTFFGLAHAKRRLEANEVKEEEAAPVEEEAAPAQTEVPQDVNEAFAVADLDNSVATYSEEKHDEYDTMQDFVSEPEEQVAQPEEIVVEEVNDKKDSLNKDDLASLLKDVVRDIVRDEIARSNAARAEQERANYDRHSDRSITGATFGGPLVVQYFNGGINGQSTPTSVVPAPAPAPAPTPAPKAEPKKVEEKKEEVAPVVVPSPVEEVQEVEAAPVEENTEEIKKAPIIRIPFEERIVSADKDMQSNYNELKNEILSYGVNSRISNSGDTFRLHRKTYVKITVAGKSLKLYFALNPADYADSKMPIGDASQHAVYAEIPLIFKVKSGLSLRRAKELIRDVMTPDGLTQGEIASTNWVKEIKANLKNK